MGFVAGSFQPILNNSVTFLFRFGCNKLKGKKKKETNPKPKSREAVGADLATETLENDAVPAFIVISICQICTGLLLFFVYMGLLKVSLVPALGSQG